MSLRQGQTCLLFETPVPLTLCAFSSVCGVNKPVDTLVVRVGGFAHFSGGLETGDLRVCTANKRFKGNHSVLASAARVLKYERARDRGRLARPLHKETRSLVRRSILCAMARGPSSHPLLSWKKHESKHSVWPQ